MEENQHSIRQHSPACVISAGTQVVLQVSKPILDNDSEIERYKKPGAVGRVSKSPDRVDDAYLIEFSDGAFVAANFHELTLRRREVDNQLANGPGNMRPYIIYKCIVGSKAYGLDHNESDDDVRGFYLPPARLHWSLYALPEQIESNDNGHDEVFWEIEKLIRLALKANPNVLETLWTPIVLETSPVATELRSLRESFLSKHLHKTYAGYVLSQFRRMKNSIERTGQYKQKHAMHLIRLLYSGIEALKGNGILIDVGPVREELLNIRDGELSFDQVWQRAVKLDEQFQLAAEKTSLPDQPDYATVDDFLIRARRSMSDA